MGSIFLLVSHLAPLLQEDYRDNSPAYFQLLELAVRSLDEASRIGVPLRGGERMHIILLGNKGDWPYLVALVAIISRVLFDFCCGERRP